MFNNGKVVFLFVPGPMGGAEKIVAHGLKSLIETGVQASVWVIKEERVPHVAEEFIKLLKNENIPYTVFSAEKIIDFKLMKNLRQEFAAVSPSIIHAHGFKAAVYGNMTKNSKARYVVTHHGKTGHTLKVKIYEYIELQVMKKADAVIAVSQDMKKMLQNDGVKQAKLHVIENFMTTTTYPALKKSSETLKFLFVGRLSPEKGCDVLIQALNKDMELTIVGDGVDRKRLEDLSRGLKVHFLGFRNDVATIMSEHDVVVMPSYREGQPLTLIEACCLGLPVVASDVGGIPELIKNGENGLLCESGNSSALRDKLVKMQNEFKKFSGEAQNQKEKFRIRFSASNWAVRSSEIYIKLFNQV